MTSPLVYILIAPLFLAYTTALPAEVVNTAAQRNGNAVHATAEQTDIVVIDVEQSIEIDQNNSEVKDSIEIITEATSNITDPGCVEKWVNVRGQGKVLASCEELCGGDEMLQERDSRPCVLINETYPERTPKEGLLGVCVDGLCVPNDPKSIIELAENATVEEAVATEPEERLPVNTEQPSAPKCENVTFVANAQATVVTRCTETCGDAVIIVPDNTTCIHKPSNEAPDVTGKCVGGNCIVENENPEKGPTDSCEKHQIIVANETIFLRCSYDCETDEVMSVPDGKPCVLSGKISERSHDYTDPLTVGVCHERLCVARNISTEETTTDATTLPAEDFPETQEQFGTVFKESCNENVIDVPGKGNVLTVCDKTCGGDEVLLLGNSAPCAVISEPYPNGSKLITLGECINGSCQIYHPVQTVVLAENSTTKVVTVDEQEETVPAETEPSRPKCENVSLIANGKEVAVTRCTDPCGDEVRVIPNNWTCIHHTSTEEAGVFGKCKDGECVLEAENPDEGPKDRCKNHVTSVNNETIYLNCTYTCEVDEVITAQDGALCYLEDEQNLYSAKGTGRCQSGRCEIEKTKVVTDNPQTEKPNCTNPNVVYHNKTIAVSLCKYKCGDMMGLEPDDTICVPDIHKNNGGSYTVGHCKGGDCVTGPKDTNPTGPPDLCNRHKINTTGEIVFLTCGFSCELDEMYSLFQREPCLLSKAESQLDLYAASYEVGMCIEGQCVKRNDSAVDYDTASNAASTDSNGPTEVEETTTVNVEATAGGELVAVE